MPSVAWSAGAKVAVVLSSGAVAVAVAATIYASTGTLETGLLLSEAPPTLAFKEAPSPDAINAPPGVPSSTMVQRGAAASMALESEGVGAPGVSGDEESSGTGTGEPSAGSSGTPPTSRALSPVSSPPLTAGADEAKQPTSTPPAVDASEMASSTTSSNPSTSSTEASGPDVRPSDVLLHLPGGTASFGSGWGSVQCVGQQVPARDALAAFAEMAGGERAAVRVETVGGEEAIALRTRSSDALFAKGSRCELSAGQTRVPRSVPIWVSFDLRSSDWAETSDAQIVAQFHDGDHTVGKSPTIAWYVVGDRLEIVVRHDASASPTNQTASSVTIYRGIWNYEEWTEWTVEANLSPFAGAGGFVRVWSGDKLVADYRGPVGYNVAEEDYLKFGYYHWLGSGNSWDTSVGTRTVWVKDVALVRDSAGRYDHRQIDRFAAE